MIPASGIMRLKSVLDEIVDIAGTHAKPSAERKNRAVEDPDSIARSVYVSGLAWSTTNEGLAAHFSQIGTVDRATVLYKTRGGESISLGCGVVEYRTQEEAARAIDVLTSTELDGRTIKCREDRSLEEMDYFASPSGNGKGSKAVQLVGTSSAGINGAGESGAKLETAGRTLEPTKVFVTSLPWETTSKDLDIVFGAVGKVVSSELLVTKKGRSLGHAVVEYTTVESANEAIARLNGQELAGRVMVVREYYTN
mmetsp:Transcript_18462/g.31042  ORF Transcript_18462/g.31042 Transcript_18462/m.31042 type:complete len:253 (-) Transcript_18462:611-1369(-)